MNHRHIRIHGDNIVECERSLLLLSKAIGSIPKLMTDSPAWMPMFMLGTIQVDLLSGHGRWGVDLAGVLSEHGGILRESADSYFTEIIDGKETILFALEYCSALPAGNNAWQRNGRALSSALAGIPYLYLAEIGGVELDKNRRVKAPRFPNPVVPFSFLMMNNRWGSCCLPIFTAHPSITEGLYNRYSDVFGFEDCLQMISAIVKGQDCSQRVESLTLKALKMVELLTSNRSHVDSLKGNKWESFLKSSNSVKWLQKYSTNLIWKKKTSSKVVVTSSFKRLFDYILSLSCITIGAREVPICIIPQDKQAALLSFMKKLYPKDKIDFGKSRPLAIVWITGFKPRGDDSRPDRGLVPLARMILGNDAFILAVVSGPAKPSTWETFKEDPEKLSVDNGLWQSLFNLCDYVLIDSKTSKETFFYQTKSQLQANDTSVTFNYVMPTVSFSEHDIDTCIHLLFSRKERLDVFECLCNPPGGDWSGISYFVNDQIECRWTSLPRVSQVGGKRPDHIVQIRKANRDIFLSIESKLYGRDLKGNIGVSLKTYIDDLFRNLPTACRAEGERWHLFDQNTLRIRPYSIISVGAFKYKGHEEMTERMKNGKLDMVMAFEFGQPTILHVLQKAKDKAVEELLEQVQLDLQWLKIQIH